MSDALSPERLAEIAARAAAATAGPWMADGAEIYRAPWGFVVIDFWVGETLRIDDHGGSNADAEFVAHARTDVPALLAEIDRLRVERDQFADRVDTLTAVAKGNKRHVAELMGDLSAAQARTAELERSAAPAAAPQPEEACSCMPHRKFACGHCEMDVCADCGRCCSCTCGQSGGAV